MSGAAGSSASTSTSASPLRRVTETYPGYDCFAKSCGKKGCGTRPDASHGIRSDEWVYVVTDGIFALSLRVFTDCVGGRRHPSYTSGTYPEGAYLVGHAGSPVSEDQIKEGVVGDECPYLDAGRCFSCWSSSLQAGEFFKAYGGDAYEQEERFWIALETKWEEVRASVESDRPAVMRCTCCGGRGAVPT